MKYSCLLIKYFFDFFQTGKLYDLNQWKISVGIYASNPTTFVYYIHVDLSNQEF